jgi:hypothetical protein
MSFLMGFGTDTTGNIGYRTFEMWNGAFSDAPNRTIQLGYSSFGGDFGGSTANMWLRVMGNGGATPGEPLGVNTTIAVDGSLPFGADGGAVHLFVLRFDLTSAAGFDVIQLFVDPADLTTEGANTPNAIFVGDFVADRLSAETQYIFGDISTLPASIGIFDELRIGGDWNSVLPIPEPGTATLLGLGSLGLLMARRNKRA